MTTWINDYLQKTNGVPLPNETKASLIENLNVYADAKQQEGEITARKEASKASIMTTMKALGMDFLEINHFTVKIAPESEFESLDKSTLVDALLSLGVGGDILEEAFNQATKTSSRKSVVRISL